jgi:hypothetical protein
LSPASPRGVVYVNGNFLVDLKNGIALCIHTSHLNAISSAYLATAPMVAAGFFLVSAKYITAK